VTVLTVGTPVAHAATPDTVNGVDCAGWLGTPVSGSAEWNAADADNLQCAGLGLRVLQESPAVAAAKAANADAGDGDFVGDPFRAPHRWAPERGSYEQVTFTDRDENTWPATLFGPRDARGGGPYPGVLLVCHACFPLPATTENVGLWYWAAEALAEAGYVVLYATVGGNSIPHTIDATDFFVSTPSTPTARGEFNPWWARLDRDRLGIVGHSGAAGVALNVGNSDPRFDAIVAWDPAASASFVGVTPRIPTMIQAADYTLREGPVPRAEKPVPAPGSKYTFFDAIRAARVDTMLVAPRASTHLDWTRFAGANPFGPSIDHGVYGEMVATYYTLAWLDRYVAASGAAPTRWWARTTSPPSPPPRPTTSASTATSWTGNWPAWTRSRPRPPQRQVRPKPPPADGAAAGTAPSSISVRSPPRRTATTTTIITTATTITTSAI